MNRRISHALYRARGAVLPLATALAVAGCDSVLDVENPNELLEENLVGNPAAAAALANGALSTVARAVSEAIVAHDAASDELVFIGSRTAWLDLQQGRLRDPTNEHLDRIWSSIARGRWMADMAVRVLEEFEAEGDLANPALLARSRLYSATMYAYIADWWEDFPLGSDRREASPPLGPANMIQMYDAAIENLDAALSTARARGDRDLELKILAQRARIRHARAVWQKLNPAGTPPSDPLVSDPQMVADAEAALALAGSETWRWVFEYSSSTVDNDWGSWVNSRLDLRVSDAYVQATRDGRRVQAVTLKDPIDGVVDPVAKRRIEEAIGGFYQPITVVSAAELRLLLAEAALAEGDVAGFTRHVNAIRVQEGLTPYAGQIQPLALLKHMRKSNLVLMGRRLNDQYRFGDRSFQWLPTSEAASRAGTKFPITIVELQSNCHILGTC